MTAEEIRAFCDNYALAWERRDLTALMNSYTEDCDIISPIFRTLTGRAQLEGSFRELFRAFSDYVFQVDDIIVDNERGDRAVLVFTAHATHCGEIFGVPGTNKRFEIRGAFIFTFRDRQIARDHRLYDFTAMLMKLGILKAKAS